MDIYVCYFPTGSVSEEHKRQLVDRLKQTFAPSNLVLSVLMGDWNFVMKDEDLCMSWTSQPTPTKTLSLALKSTAYT